MMSCCIGDRTQLINDLCQFVTDGEYLRLRDCTNHSFFNTDVTKNINASWEILRENIINLL